MSRISVALKENPIGKMFLKDTDRGMELFRVEAGVVCISTYTYKYKIRSCKDRSHAEVVSAPILADLLHGPTRFAEPKSRRVWDGEVMYEDFII